MARRRKTHVQQALRWHNAAGDLRGRKREAPSAASRRGKRKLGRPKKPGAKQRHEKRPVFASERVLHVTLRVERSIGRLRTRACYRAIREAAVTVLPHEDCRIVQLSIQVTHVHLLVEADHSEALARGMQAFQISAAKHINAAVSRAGSWWERRRARALAVGGASARGSRLDVPTRSASDSRLDVPTRSAGGSRLEVPTAPAGSARLPLPTRRKGRVFADRYHARFVSSPLQARRELAYVLNNWRKHGEDRRSVARGWRIDPFSTGWTFMGWREHAGAGFARWDRREDHADAWSKPPTYEPIPVYAPRSWLLGEGWKRHGLIGMREVPSVRAS